MQSVMAFFNFFGEGEHRVLKYKPMYYDPNASENAETGEKGKKKGAYVPGAYIKESMGEGPVRKSHMNRVTKLIGICSLLLIAVILFYIAKFYSLL